MSAKLSHRVPLPDLGEGVYLFFSMQAISDLEEIYGEGQYFETIERNVNNASAKTTMNCLKVALMKEGKKVDINFSGELDFDIGGLGPSILDALSLAMAGRTYADLLAEAERRLAERQARIARMTDEEYAKEAAEKQEDPFEDSAASSDSKRTGSSRGSNRRKSGV